MLELQVGDLFGILGDPSIYELLEIRDNGVVAFNTTHNYEIRFSEKLYNLMYKL